MNVMNVMNVMNTGGGNTGGDGNTLSRPCRHGRYGVVISALSMILGTALWLWPAPSRAEIEDIDSSAYSALPLFVDFGGGGTTSASFLLALSRDEQLFYKAYSDYGDLDGDNIGENTYKHSFEYYGLFDPQKCYSYDTTNQRFVPQGFSRRDAHNNYTFECNTVGRYWSGNFMNWATTVRLDIVQKVLYGGRRVVDTSTTTVLEGAYLVPDSHSFTKYIDDADLITRVTPVRWSDMMANPWTPLTDADRVLTICRTSGPAPGNQRIWSMNFTPPPKIKIVNRDFRLWDLQGGRQCGSGGSSFTTAHHRPSFAPSAGPWAERFVKGDGTRVGSTWSNYTDMYMGHRVQVCVPAHINADNKENCKQYPDGNFKPIGVIQKHGEAPTEAKFGLMTTSHRNPHEGGLLRRRLKELGTTEINASDGTFTTYALANIPADGLIIQALDGLYMVGGRYSSNSPPSHRDVTYSAEWAAPDYSPAFLYHPPCSSFLFPNLDQNCLAWGNPFSEMLQEAVRYVSGEDSPTAAYQVAIGRSLEYLQGPTEVYSKNLTWAGNGDLLPADDPNSTACEVTNILSINASVISVDGDDLVTTGPVTEANIETYTNTVGTLEGLGGSLIMASATGTVDGFDDDICTLQTFTNLSSVRGLCPDASGLGGSYLAAGLAYYSHTQDLKTTADGDQTINHLFVDLRPNVPQIVVPLDSLGSSFVGKTAVIQPAYGNHIYETGITTWPQYGPAQFNYEWSTGRLTKFYAVEPPRTYTEAAPGSTSAPPAMRTVYGGTYLVAWEDTASGTDFDEDVWGFVDFILDPGDSGATPPRSASLEIGTEVVGQNADSGQHLFGFTVLGTTQDGFHAYSGHMADTVRIDIRRLGGGAGQPGRGPGAFVYNDPVNVGGGPNAVPSCGTTQTQTNPADPSTTQAVDLRRPNGTVRTSTAGCVGEQGRVSHLFTPSGNDFAVLQPPLFYAAKYGGFKDSNDNGRPDLVSEWDAVNLEGEAVADGIPDAYFPVSNPARLPAALDRAFVQGGVSQSTASGTAAALVANEREGLGAVFQALFEPIREDAAGNEVEWVGTLHALFIDREGLLREDSNSDGTLAGYDVDKVVELFYNETLGETQVLLYTSSDADTFTSSGSAVVSLEEMNTLWNSREQLSAVADVAANRIYGVTLASTGRYIFTWRDDDNDERVSTGEEVAFVASEFAGAKANFLDVEATEVADLILYLRGGTPASARNRVIDYDGDGTTEIMRLGDIVNSSPAAVTLPSEGYDLLAGDGSYALYRLQYMDRRQMVYVGANDGMLHAFNAGFYDSATQTVDLESGPSLETKHPLGSEMWAYVPRNMQPYLKWLADPDYSHVFYVDAPPRVFDAKAFAANAIHRGGWGTILVVGFRLGGGGPTNHITVDVSDDGLGPSNSDSDDTDDLPMLSAFVVMDVTYPEEPPTLLAELSPKNVGYSFSQPAVIPMGDEWYLVFGSGPTNATLATSTNQAQLYVYNLKALAKREATPVATVFQVPGATNSFIGGIVVVDGDLDLRSDALYFGSVSGNSGGLYRMRLNEAAIGSWNDPAVLLAANKPFSSEPTVAVDDDNNRWIYAGTGRLLATGDNAHSGQQTLYGFIDPPLSGDTAVTESNLVNVSSARSFTNGQVDVNGDSTLDKSFQTLRDEVATAGGWKRNYNISGTNPSERGLNVSTLIGEVLFNTAYTPPSSASTAAGCGNAVLGNSVLLGLDFLSGVPHTFGVFGTTACTLQVCTVDGVEESVGETSLGRGMSSLPSLHLGKPGEDAPGQITVVVQQSTGEVKTVEAQGFSAAESVELDWGELLRI